MFFLSARGALQLAHGTVLVIDEPEVVSPQLLERACHQLAVQERPGHMPGKATEISGVVKREDDHRDLSVGQETPFTKGRGICRGGSPGGEPSEEEKEETRKKVLGMKKAAANLRALESLLAEGHVEYDFVYSKQRIKMDVVPICCTSSSFSSIFSAHLLHLPVGNALKETNTKREDPQPDLGVGAERAARNTPEVCAGSCKASHREEPGERLMRQEPGKAENSQNGPPTEEELFQWRALIGMASRRVDGVNIDEETRQAMIEDWVQIRQKDRTVKSTSLFLSSARFQTEALCLFVHSISFARRERWKVFVAPASVASPQ